MYINENIEKKNQSVLSLILVVSYGSEIE